MSDLLVSDVIHGIGAVGGLAASRLSRHQFVRDTGLAVAAAYLGIASVVLFEAGTAYPYARFALAMPFMGCAALCWTWFRRYVHSGPIEPVRRLVRALRDDPRRTSWSPGWLRALRHGAAMRRLAALTVVSVTLSGAVEQYAEPIGPEPAPGVESAQGDNDPTIHAYEVQASSVSWDDALPWGGNPPPWYEDPDSVNCKAAPSWCDGNGTVTA